MRHSHSNVTEQAIEDTQTALNEAQTALPPLRDAAESQQRKVLAMTQEHHDAQVSTTEATALYPYTSMHNAASSSKILIF